MSGVGSIVVLVLGLEGWLPAEAVHEAAGVVPVDPVGGGELDFEGVGEAVVERGRGCAGADAFGLVEADDALGEGIVIRIANGSDRCDRTDLREPLGVAQRGVLRAGIRMLNEPP